MDIAPPAHAYAHVSEDGTRTQTVYEHLHNTAVLAAGFGKAFGAAEQAYLAGMLHDIGKYSAAFQRRLAGSTERVDHSVLPERKRLLQDGSRRWPLPLRGIMPACPTAAVRAIPPTGPL